MKEEDIRPQNIFNTFLKLIEEDIKIYFVDKKIYIKINCPACKSRDYEFIFIKNNFNFVKCNICQTLFCNPRPSFKQIKRFYKTSESIRYFATEFYPRTEENRRKLIFIPRVEYIKYLKKKYNLKQNGERN